MRTVITFVIVMTVIVILPVGIVHAASFNAAGIRLTKEVKPWREIRHSKVVTQSLDFSCGAAGLATLFNYYLNDKVSEREIIERLLVTVPIEKVRKRHGFSLYDLKTFARERGYVVTGYQMDLDFLKELHKPVLVPIKFRNYNHFVIVRGVVGDRVFLADPAAGNMSMKTDQFERIWGNGIGLVIEKVGGQSAPYALEVGEDDCLLADHKYLSRLLDPDMIRTAVFPSEY